MNEPIQAEWASGRRKASLSLVLLLLGCSALAASIVISLQIFAVPSFGRGLGRSSLLIPAWGLVAIGLALLTRRSDGPQYVRAVSIGWLLIAVAAFGWLSFNHG